MHMYHSWGSQNAWLRQITNENRLFVHRDTAAHLDLIDDDWVWIESDHARVKGQIRLVDGVNPNTVWTWNAIGKRRGAWMLDKDAPEAERGFLLNHAISDLLPPDTRGRRYSNSDPVTGQAAWFDLRVRLRKCAAEEAGFTEPHFAPLAAPKGLPEAPRKLRFGAGFRAKREARP
jgi:anaerobic selenocysteine-containing dehydrogenase